MKKYLLLLLLLPVLACTETIVKPAELAYLNGYWEINRAVAPDGAKKEYKINETIDYFQVKDNKGFRKKVMPQFDGRYLVNDQQENLTIVTGKDGHFYIAYKTAYATWRDEIVSIAKDEMILRDTRGLDYFYKRPQKFSLK